MVERPHQVIQKTTSRIAFLGLAVATMVITLSLVGSVQLQQASAAPPNWCVDYTIPDQPTTSNCSYTSKQACEDARSETAPQYNPSSCYKQGSEPKANWCVDYTIPDQPTTSNCSYTSKQACEDARSETAPQYNPSRCYRERN